MQSPIVCSWMMPIFSCCCFFCFLSTHMLIKFGFQGPLPTDYMQSPMCFSKRHMFNLLWNHRNFPCLFVDLEDVAVSQPAKRRKGTSRRAAVTTHSVLPPQDATSQEVTNKHDNDVTPRVRNQDLTSSDLPVGDSCQTFTIGTISSGQIYKVFLPTCSGTFRFLH